MRLVHEIFNPIPSQFLVNLQIPHHHKLGFKPSLTSSYYYMDISQVREVEYPETDYQGPALASTAATAYAKVGHRSGKCSHHPEMFPNNSIGFNLVPEPMDMSGKGFLPHFYKRKTTHIKLSVSAL